MRTSVMIALIFVVAIAMVATLKMFARTSSGFKTAEDARAHVLGDKDYWRNFHAVAIE